jgi:hypothetical protein
MSETTEEAVRRPNLPHEGLYQLSKNVRKRPLESMAWRAVWQWSGHARCVNPLMSEAVTSAEAKETASLPIG